MLATRGIVRRLSAFVLVTFLLAMATPLPACPACTRPAPHHAHHGGAGHSHTSNNSAPSPGGCPHRPSGTPLRPTATELIPTHSDGRRRHEMVAGPAGPRGDGRYAGLGADRLSEPYGRPPRGGRGALPDPPLSVI